MFRYTSATLGRRAQTLCTPSTQTSSSRMLALAPAQTNNSHHRLHTRLSSTSSKFGTLTPPWQFEDLPGFERRAFERWGPNYFNYLAPEKKEFAHKLAEKRAQTAAELEEEFGSDWYTILREATRIKDEHEHAQLKMLLVDAQYRQGDRATRKTMQREFFDKEKATKTERLRELMRGVAQNRGTF